MRPEFFPGRRIQRHQRALFGRHVGDIIDDDRTKRVGCIVACKIVPGNFQLVDIFCIDLLESRIVRAVRTTQIVPPGGARLLRKRDPDKNGKKRSCGTEMLYKNSFHALASSMTYFESRVDPAGARI